MSYLTIWEGRQVVKSRDLVSLSQAFSFILFWVFRPLSSCLLPLCSLSIMLSSFSSHIHLSGCPAAPPFPSSPPTSVSAPSHLDVCAVSLCPLFHFIFFSFPPIFLSHSPAHFSCSLLHSVMILRFGTKNLPHVQSPVVRMNLGK